MDIVNTQVWAVPNLNACEHSLVILDVLTRDQAGKYAAYRAIVDEEYPHQDWFLSRCAGRGSKLRFVEAKASFPFLTEEVYRA